MAYQILLVQQTNDILTSISKLLTTKEKQFFISKTSKVLEMQDLILQLQPDLVIVNLKENGIEIIQSLNQILSINGKLPTLIAIASTQEFCYPCLKLGFFDYLIQPIKAEEIEHTIKRFLLQFPEKEASKICLKTYKDFHYIDVKSIVYLQADNNSTDFFLTNGKVVSAFRTLKYFENRLPSTFYRIQQSYIVNAMFINRINFGRQACYISDFDKKIPFTKTYKSNVSELNTFLASQTDGKL